MGVKLILVCLHAGTSAEYRFEAMEYLPQIPEREVNVVSEWTNLLAATALNETKVPEWVAMQNLKLSGRCKSLDDARNWKGFHSQVCHEWDFSRWIEKEKERHENMNTDWPHCSKKSQHTLLSKKMDSMMGRTVEKWSPNTDNKKAQASLLHSNIKIYWQKAESRQNCSCSSKKNFNDNYVNRGNTIVQTSHLQTANAFVM